MRRASVRSPSRAVALARSSRHVGSSGTRVGEPPGLFVLNERVGDLVEVAGEDLVELVERESCHPTVGGGILLEVVRADLLGPAAAADLTPTGLRCLGLLSLLLLLEDA